MKTHEQAREEAEKHVRQLLRTLGYVPIAHEPLIDVFTTAILDAQKEAVKEAARLAEDVAANLQHNTDGMGKCWNSCLVCRAQQFLTTYEQRNDEGRE